MKFYIIKSLHSNWIKVGHHLITERRPSVYYRFINRGFYTSIRPKEIEDRVSFDDLQLIYWFTNLNIQQEKSLHKKLRLSYEYNGEWYKYENLNDILNIIYNDYNGYLQMPSIEELNYSLKWRDDLKEKRKLPLNI